MAARDLKASMGKGNEIPQSREEYLKQKKALEEASNVSVQEDKVIEAPKTVSIPKTNLNTPQAQRMTNNNAEYVRKGYYHLTEENYWYLKDITFFKNIQIQDYLNQLIELDRQANSEILHVLPHGKEFYKNGEIYGTES